MTPKRIFLWIFALILVGGSVWGLIKITQSSASQPTNQTAIDEVSSRDWVAGTGKAVLVEYSDFQCPACGAYYPLLKKLVEEYGSEFTFVYRHFPLQQHLNAIPTASASEAAGKQGKFWEMHSLIFNHQQEWSAAGNINEILLGYADSLRLDIEQFKNDLRSAEVKDKVGNDYRGGINAGVNSTPTFFLNGKKIQPRSYQEFIDLITKANAANS